VIERVEIITKTYYLSRYRTVYSTFSARRADIPAVRKTHIRAVFTTYTATAIWRPLITDLCVIRDFSNDISNARYVITGDRFINDLCARNVLRAA